jgi:AcrR family transcriptional regulator
MAGRRAKGREREELIVAAAGRAIAERGLAQVRVADIAALAGISPGHVTYYFPSKTELLMRAITAGEEALAARVRAELGGIADPWRRLDRLIELSASAGVRDPGWVLWFQVWLESALHEEVARCHDELDARWRAMLLEVLRHGVSQGAFAVADPEAAAMLISAMIDGLSIQVTLGSAALTRAQMLDALRTATRSLLTR